MQRTVIGARVHSGWAAIVAMAGAPDSPEVIERRRIAFIDSTMAGAKQPYHYAENLNLPDAEEHLATCEQASQGLASGAIRELVEDLRGRGFQVAGCAVLLAAGRPLPPLADVLASHALIHTAEGEFFRRVIREACEAHSIAVTGIRERDLELRAAGVFGVKSEKIRQRILNLGRVLGPPWSEDQKLAALAASVVLGEIVDRRTEAASPLG